MRASEMLDDTFPHGTVEGFMQGCTGSMCPGAVPCRVVHRRYHGDYRFRMLIESGLSPAEAVARENEEAAEAARVRAVELQARRAAKSGKVAPVEVPVPDFSPVVAPLPLPKRATVQDVADALESLVGALRAFTVTVVEALAEREAAAQSAEPEPERAAEPVAERAAAPSRVSRRMTDADVAEIRALHAQGLSDNLISKAIGRNQSSVSQRLRLMGLPPHGVKGRPGVSPR